MAYTSELPATVTIKNEMTAATETQDLWNTGLAAAAGGDALKAEALKVPQIGIKGDHIEIPVFGNQNKFVVLTPEEEIKLTCTTDEEVLFYLGMAKKDVLTVTKAAAAGVGG